MDVPSVHRRPDYPLVGCAPAEPASVSSGATRLLNKEPSVQEQERRTGMLVTQTKKRVAKEHCFLV
jgi:hypothetical protein